MKKIIGAITFLILVGCNPKIPKNDDQNSSKEENIENGDFPLSNYFKITKVFSGEYNKQRGFDMDFEIMNISDYKFSSVDLHGDTYCKLKNSDKICQSTVQTIDWVVDNKKNNWPHQIVNWEPHTTRRISFTCPTWCSATFDRTPEELNLILRINAISIDKEIEGIFVNYDILPLWQERQVKEGLR